MYYEQLLKKIEFYVPFLHIVLAIWNKVIKSAKIKPLGRFYVERSIISYFLLALPCQMHNFYNCYAYFTSFPWNIAAQQYPKKYVYNNIKDKTLVLLITNILFHDIVKNAKKN